MKNLRNIPVYFSVSQLQENCIGNVLGHDRPRRQFLQFFRHYCSPTTKGYPTILKQETIPLAEELIETNTIKLNLYNS